MRVTKNLMAGTMTRNLFKNIEQVFKTQNVISTGKRINRPSDDPIGIGKVLNYRAMISSIEQYDKNIAHGESWLDLTDSTLDSVGESLIRAKELALSQANATANENTMDAVAEEVKNIYDHILQLANTRFENSYIFAGHNTDTAPFSRNDDYIASYSGEAGDAEVTEITCLADTAGNLDGKNLTLNSPSTDYYVWYNVDGDSVDPALADCTGIEVSIETNEAASDVASKTAVAIDYIFGLGAEVIGNKVTVTNTAPGDVIDSADNNTAFLIATIQGTDGDRDEINIIARENLEITINENGHGIFLSRINIFELLREFKVALETNDSTAISEQLLEPFDDALDQILEVRANAGAKLNRLESTKNHLADFKLNIEQILSDTENADIIKAISELSKQETAYQASLSVSAKRMQGSTLMDFLR